MLGLRRLLLLLWWLLLLLLLFRVSMLLLLYLMLLWRCVLESRMALLLALVCVGWLLWRPLILAKLLLGQSLRLRVPRGSLGGLYFPLAR